MRGSVWPWLILPALLVYGCSPALQASDPRTRLPILQGEPMERPCWFGDRKAACVMLLKADWELLVIDLKEKCVSLGGTPANCQTEPTVQKP
jgi:hypothetical protein